MRPARHGWAHDLVLALRENQGRIATAVNVLVATTAIMLATHMFLAWLASR